MGVLGANGISLIEALPLTGGTLTDTLTIDQNANASSLVIDSEATSATVLAVDSAQTTTGNIVNITSANSLTTGRILNIESNSANTSSRVLNFIHNNNPSAVGCTVAQFRQDAAIQCIVLDQNAASSFIDYQGTAAANATDPISTLTTSGATTNHIQIEINGAKAWIAVSTTDPS